MAESIRRIVLLGKNGSGKSSLANTLFGEKDFFKVGNSPSSETKRCTFKTKVINGRSVHLIDTPGLFDTDGSDQMPELLKAITECAPGPHAFLLVLKIDRFTDEDNKVVEQIRKNFSDKALKFTTLVFTRGDELPEGMKIKEWACQNEALKELVQKCGGRCHVFDNKYWNNSQDSYRNNQVQVRELLRTIERTVERNGGGYYTNEMLDKVQRSLENKMRSGQSHQMAKESTWKDLLISLASSGIGIVLSFFLGKGGAAGEAIGKAITKIAHDKTDRRSLQ